MNNMKLDELHISFYPTSSNEDKKFETHEPPKQKKTSFHRNLEDGPDDLILHKVADSSELASKWCHIDDLDSFFKRIYVYHQSHGFRVMILQEVLDVVQFVFIVCVTLFFYECVNYGVLFHKENPQRSDFHVGDKVLLTDVTRPFWFTLFNSASFSTWVAICISAFVMFVKLVVLFHHVFQFHDVKSFFNEALNISDSQLGTVKWSEVQLKLIAAQKRFNMCVHKKNLSELDIYHRILRYTNYMVAMINKDCLPVHFSLPFSDDQHVYFTQGLRYNLHFLFFKGPWAPFDQYHLKSSYKKHASSKKKLVIEMETTLSILTALNILFLPLIFSWQLIHSFFQYAEMIKRDPSSLGIRRWSPYARLYLRHFNELDHEFDGRLNRAFRPANRYISLFSSPLLSVVCRNVAFMCGAVFASLIILTVWDEDVLNVEHMITIMSGLGLIIAVCKASIPEENLVFNPDQTFGHVLSQIHYFPHEWAPHSSSSKDGGTLQHKRFVRNQKRRTSTSSSETYSASHPTFVHDMSQLFPLTMVNLFFELISPILTPILLFTVYRKRASTFVDFFRNFTVDVVGVGDVCSFAQMDIRHHGDSTWHPPMNDSFEEEEECMRPSVIDPPPGPSTRGHDEEEVLQDACSQQNIILSSVVETPHDDTNTISEASMNGKTEMSLLQFTLKNPKWRPPSNCQTAFLHSFIGQVNKDLDGVVEQSNNVAADDNALISSMMYVSNPEGEQDNPKFQCRSSASFHTPWGSVGEGGIKSPYSLMDSVHEGIKKSSSQSPTAATVGNGIDGLAKAMGLANSHNSQQDSVQTDMSVSALYLHHLHSNKNSERQGGHLTPHSPIESTIIDFNNGQTGARDVGDIHLENHNFEPLAPVSFGVGMNTIPARLTLHDGNNEDDDEMPPTLFTTSTSNHHHNIADRNNLLL